MDFPHSVIYPFAGRFHGDPNKKGAGLCKKCGMPEDSLTGQFERCFLAKAPGEDRKRHRKVFEAGR